MVKIFKLKKETTSTFPIELNVFERVTREQAPYYQKNKTGKTQQFAICPGCNNPVQIIGLYNHLKHTKNAFGRHSPRPVSGFSYDADAYEFCPYLLQNSSHDSSSRKEPSSYSCDILKLAIQQFDRVVYVLKEDMGFNVSLTFAKNMLRTYLKEQGYLYPGSSLRNIPWIMGYLSFSKSLFGQYLQSGPKYGALQKAIFKNIPEARVTADGWVTRKGTTEYNLQCFLTNHKISETRDGGLQETIRFIIISGRDEGPRGITGKEIWDEKISFDHAKFERLMNVRTEKYRNQKLLECAKTEYQNHLREFPMLKEFLA